MGDFRQNQSLGRWELGNAWANSILSKSEVGKLPEQTCDLEIKIKILA
jgi:hypothetical protein